MVYIVSFLKFINQVVSGDPLDTTVTKRAEQFVPIMARVAPQQEHVNW